MTGTDKRPSWKQSDADFARDKGGPTRSDLVQRTCTIAPKFFKFDSYGRVKRGQISFELRMPLLLGWEVDAGRIFVYRLIGLGGNVENLLSPLMHTGLERIESSPRCDWQIRSRPFFDELIELLTGRLNTTPTQWRSIRTLPHIQLAQHLLSAIDELGLYCRKRDNYRLQVRLKTRQPVIFAYCQLTDHTSPREDSNTDSDQPREQGLIPIEPEFPAWPQPLMRRRIPQHGGLAESCVRRDHQDNDDDAQSRGDPNSPLTSLLRTHSYLRSDRPVLARADQQLIALDRRGAKTVALEQTAGSS